MQRDHNAHLFGGGKVAKYPMFSLTSKLDKKGFQTEPQ